VELLCHPALQSHPSGGGGDDRVVGSGSESFWWVIDFRSDPESSSSSSSGPPQRQKPTRNDPWHAPIHHRQSPDRPPWPSTHPPNHYETRARTRTGQQSQTRHRSGPDAARGRRSRRLEKKDCVLRQRWCMADAFPCRVSIEVGGREGINWGGPRNNSSS
jgi:hypothetical protein